jgi:hypothetical protein
MREKNHKPLVGQDFSAIRRTNSRQIASAASPRRWCSSGVSGGSPPSVAAR